MIVAPEVFKLVALLSSPLVSTWLDSETHLKSFVSLSSLVTTCVALSHPYTLAQELVAVDVEAEV